MKRNLVKRVAFVFSLILFIIGAKTFLLSGEVAAKKVEKKRAHKIFKKEERALLKLPSTNVIKNKKKIKNEKRSIESDELQEICGESFQKLYESDFMDDHQEVFLPSISCFEKLQKEKNSFKRLRNFYQACQKREMTKERCLDLALLFKVMTMALNREKDLSLHHLEQHEVYQMMIGTLFLWEEEGTQNVDEMLKMAKELSNRDPENYGYKKWETILSFIKNGGEDKKEDLDHNLQELKNYQQKDSFVNDLDIFLQIQKAKDANDFERVKKNLQEKKEKGWDSSHYLYYKAKLMWQKGNYEKALLLLNELQEKSEKTKLHEVAANLLENLSTQNRNDGVDPFHLVMELDIPLELGEEFTGDSF